MLHWKKHIVLPQSLNSSIAIQIPLSLSLMLIFSNFVPNSAWIYNILELVSAMLAITDIFFVNVLMDLAELF